MSDDPIRETLANARRALLAARGPHGHWEGELSSSALSTATAVFALSLHARSAGGTDARRQLIAAGLRWLADHQNPDGGWGDTVLSFSNISTTALCWAVLNIPEATAFTDAATKAEGWLRAAAGSLDPEPLAKAIADRYGRDRTFSVPILTMLTLAGRLGPGGWRLVPQLPFELAACPHRWFQWVRLPVVSYALPALIAIGQVRHHHRPTWNPLARIARHLTRAKTLRVLRAIQPTTGGYLEATPLTSFVLMSLTAAGRGDSPVVAHGLEFLARSARPDGSWPIDTNLATWVTTLAVNALGDALPETDRPVIRDWLLAQQHRTVHPYTRAAPGGWAWTDLAGGVPDADDTPGALLALAKLGDPDGRSREAAVAGARWLLDLQNSDGGIPTFCRGWTGLPFDRSSADLTAHTLLAWDAWHPHLPADLRQRVDSAAARAVRYLVRTQRPDGAWAPLWFGCQHTPEVENLTYGTSRVLRLARVTAWPFGGEWLAALDNAGRWLAAAQNPDGGWGGRPGAPSTVEETALAVEGLASARHPRDRPVRRGGQWLAAATARGTDFPPAPIGFYFANLWYFDRLYPLAFGLAGLDRLVAGAPPLAVRDP
jgi:squalene-hopene/tetraprenyl-beta-curcumene cyclase